MAIGDADGELRSSWAIAKAAARSELTSSESPGCSTELAGVRVSCGACSAPVCGCVGVVERGTLAVGVVTWRVSSPTLRLFTMRCVLGDFVTVLLYDSEESGGPCPAGERGRRLF